MEWTYTSIKVPIWIRDKLKELMDELKVDSYWRVIHKLITFYNEHKNSQIQNLQKQEKKDVDFFDEDKLLGSMKLRRKIIRLLT